MEKKTGKKRIEALEKIAYDPYDRLEHPGTEDWKKAYDALVELTRLCPEDGFYANTLGYLCYYGRHTGGERQYREARKWFEVGAEKRVIESSYKLADMLVEGLGGPKDYPRALELYVWMYLFCREQIEEGAKDIKFADTALRMGRIFHEGKIVPKSNMNALEHLLEARYAIMRREEFGNYGDETVKANILRLIDECELPDEDIRNLPFYPVQLDQVLKGLFIADEELFRMKVDANEYGVVRLEIRRKGTGGKKARQILCSVPPAMKCFLTDFMVFYGKDVLRIWNIRPGEEVVYDRLEYDEEKREYRFLLKGELQCRIQYGEFVLSMLEFLDEDNLKGPMVMDGTDVAQ